MTKYLTRDLLRVEVSMLAHCLRKKIQSIMSEKLWYQTGEAGWPPRHMSHWQCLRLLSVLDPSLPSAGEPSTMVKPWDCPSKMESGFSALHLILWFISSPVCCPILVAKLVRGLQAGLTRPVHASASPCAAFLGWFLKVFFFFFMKYRIKVFVNYFLEDYLK